MKRDLLLFGVISFILSIALIGATHNDPSLTILYPNGGEAICINTVTLRAVSNGILSPTATVHFMLNSSTSSTYLGQGTYQNSEWQYPHTFTATGTYKVGAEIRDPAAPSYATPVGADYSDNWFSVISCAPVLSPPQPTITVTRPNGGNVGPSNGVILLHATTQSAPPGSVVHFTLKKKQGQNHDVFLGRGVIRNGRWEYDCSYTTQCTSGTIAKVRADLRASSSRTSQLLDRDHSDRWFKII